MEPDFTPRQRTRRAERNTAAMPAEQPIQQSVQPSAAYPQTPRNMYAAAPQPHPTQPAVQAPLRTYSTYRQSPAIQQTVTSGRPSQQSPNQQTARTPAPTYDVQYTQRTGIPQPKVLNQTRTVNSGWQQPVLEENPHARASRSLERDLKRSSRAAQQKSASPSTQPSRRQHSSEEYADAASEKTPARKVPAWLTTALSLSLILVMALGAAYWLMQAYLTTQENARIAAYQAMLDNYHITETPEGTRRVTWQDAIEKYAAQYNLQPAFVMAIIRNESSFRTQAESSVGARGLMQLMPDTAEWIAGKLDDARYSFDRMWDAETNIRYGCWYLGYLTRLFHGDAELISAAYHAGQTTVTQWLSDPAKSSDGVSLDLNRLNDGPTKQYIGRVTQTYGIYQKLLYQE